jgi:hypothetical protein
VGYPQGDGITERAIQNIKLRMRMAGFERISNHRLQLIVSVINMVPNAATLIPLTEVRNVWLMNDKEKNRYTEIKDRLMKNLSDYNNRVKREKIRAGKK